MSTAFFSSAGKSGFSAKLWRGERMCLLGFDVTQPEADLVGFAIECKEPQSSTFKPLMNRIAFEYPIAASDAVTGARNFPSTEAPFQKFRWVHFPFQPRKGSYTYRITKMHMPTDGTLKTGTSLTLSISLDPITYDGFLDVGFTRGFASSQAFLDKFPPGTNINTVGKTIIPAKADDGLKFTKAATPKGIYEWMGFEAHDLLFDFLDKAVKDSGITIDAFLYDFNEPDMLDRLKKLKKRLRVIIDDSSKKSAGGVTGHGSTESAESQAAKTLRTTAGAANVHRTHFKRLQHNKVLIAKKNGTPVRVLCGSTNYTFRGLYIQANNILVFDQPDIAAHFADYFQAVFDDPAGFSKTDIASKWHVVTPSGLPPVHMCFSPHKSSDLSLNPVRGAIDGAASSVFYNVAFLDMIQSGPTREAFDRLMTKPIFSYGVSDKAGGLEVKKPDGSIGLVDFAYLAKKSPQPFRDEWSGQKGINIHHKFVVTDFNLPTAKVFTGSCNFAPGGEESNGDHLILIEDQKVATSYAIEALRVFDHLQFRSAMKRGESQPSVITLRKPKKITGKPAWFENYYVPGSQKERDRLLFSH